VQARLGCRIFFKVISVSDSEQVLHKDFLMCTKKKKHCKCSLGPEDDIINSDGSDSSSEAYQCNCKHHIIFFINFSCTYGLISNIVCLCRFLEWC
jgi:hypothetical protein